MGTFRAVVTISHPSLGGTGTNTWHIRTTGLGGTDNAQLSEAVEALSQFYGDAEAAFPDTAVLHFGGTAEGILGNEGESEALESWTRSGGTPGNALPPATAIVVGWRAATGGRSGRGRTFLGPITVSALDAQGTVTNEVLGVVRTAASNLLTASEGANEWAVCVYSPQDNVLRDITTTQTRDIFAVLRSRRD